VKAYEFPAKVSQDGSVELPEGLVDRLPENHVVRVIILVDEPEDADDAAWIRLSLDQFLAGYAEEDAIYDKVGQ
jgi:hypothetical protein